MVAFVFIWCSGMAVSYFGVHVYSGEALPEFVSGTNNLRWSVCCICVGPVPWLMWPRWPCSMSWAHRQESHDCTVSLALCFKDESLWFGPFLHLRWTFMSQCFIITWTFLLVLWALLPIVGSLSIQIWVIGNHSNHFHPQTGHLVKIFPVFPTVIPVDRSRGGESSFGEKAHMRSERRPCCLCSQGQGHIARYLWLLPRQWLWFPEQFLGGLTLREVLCSRKHCPHAPSHPDQKRHALSLSLFCWLPCSMQTKMCCSRRSMVGFPGLYHFAKDIWVCSAPSLNRCNDQLIWEPPGFCPYLSFNFYILLLEKDIILTILFSAAPSVV